MKFSKRFIALSLITVILSGLLFQAALALGIASRVADINSGASNSNPSYLAVYNGALYFQANGNDGAGIELWKYDGTSASRVADINSGAGDSFSIFLTVYNGALYFGANGNDGAGFELWKYDGTSTSRVADINSGASGSIPQFLAVYNGALYFSANGNDGAGIELWKYDGTSASRVADIYSGAGSSFPEHLKLYNGALYFQANGNDGAGIELWKYDGTSASRVADINSGADDSLPLHLAVYNGALYFQANGNDGAGFELWKYDGTSASRVADINSGAGNSIPVSLAAYNGALYFSADGNDGAGRELWKYVEGNPPTVLTQTLPASNATGPSSFTVTFSEDVSNSGGGSLIDDVTNINNYKIINKGANGNVDTASCASAVGGDDTLILPSGVNYVPNTAIVTLGTLPNGNYRLFVCGTTSIVDLAGNPLAGDGVTSGTDFTFDFTVGATSARNGNKTTASSLPKTGFAPGKVTTLPAQPADLAYAKLGDLWLEIPSLGVKSTIVGVPQNADKTWDVSWLGNDTGWLNGTAFPTWTGNSVLTAHVTNASGVDGPFAALKSLKYGDQIIVHFGGVKYVYEVRVTKLARPYTTNFTFESKQDASYLTLVTCSGYNPLNESYLYRRVVRAVLVSTVSE